MDARSRARLHLAAFVLAAAFAPPVMAQAPRESAGTRADQPATIEPSDVEREGEWTYWTGGRYRITPGDLLEFTFPFVPELNQTATVQPDGYITLREIDDLRVQGRTLAQVKADVTAAYEKFVRDPAVNVTLKEFERPYFVAGGHLEKPGKYELRGATTLTQALALAGGPRPGALTSRVTLYRRLPDNTMEVKRINVARMYAKRDLSEDPLLRPGDTIVVPTSAFGKVLPALPFFYIFR
jgi:polysaccharide export outer membrane protein